MDLISDSPVRSGFALACRLLLFYAILAFFCWDEVSYRARAIEVTGECEIVGQFTYRGQLRKKARYTFKEPESGRLHQNTVTVSENFIPTSPAMIQYLPSRGTSRLSAQARPWIINLFIGVNVVLFLTVSTVIGYLAWEANWRPLTRQQRAMAAYQRRKLHSPSIG